MRPPPRHLRVWEVWSAGRPNGPFVSFCVYLCVSLSYSRCRDSSIFRVASTFYEKTDKRWCEKEKAKDKPFLYTFVYETMILESSETMLRIGKVLGTRSALTVSKWILYAYYILKN